MSLLLNLMTGSTSLSASLQANAREESKLLIYNYPASYTGQVSSQTDEQ